MTLPHSAPPRSAPAPLFAFFGPFRFSLAAATSCLLSPYPAHCSGNHLSHPSTSPPSLTNSPVPTCILHHFQSYSPAVHRSTIVPPKKILEGLEIPTLKGYVREVTVSWGLIPKDNKHSIFPTCIVGACEAPSGPLLSSPLVSWLELICSLGRD